VGHTFPIANEILAFEARKTGQKKSGEMAAQFRGIACGNFVTLGT
jgi:hypothetical protein